MQKFKGYKVIAIGWLSSLLVSLLLCMSALAEVQGIPDVGKCRSITIHKSTEPAVRIMPDGSGHLVVGTVSPYAKFDSGTFDFQKIFIKLKLRVVENKRDIEKPYVTVNFFRHGEAGSQSYFLYDDQLVAEVFQKAMARSVKLK